MSWFDSGSRWLALALLGGVACLAAASKQPSAGHAYVPNITVSTHGAPCQPHDSLAHAFDDGSFKAPSNKFSDRNGGDQGDGNIQATTAYAQAEQQQHKRLLPLDAWDFVTFAACAVILFIAAGGGIGGGAVMVPLFILVSGMSINQEAARKPFICAACTWHVFVAHVYASTPVISHRHIRLHALR